MDNGDILREIIALTRSKCECSEETESVLFENKCLYLLTQSINNRRDISHVLATNRIVTEIEYSICSSLFKRLLDIPYVLFKGAALSNRIYGRLEYRLSGDIDILTSKEYADLISVCLKEEGFTQGELIDGVIYECPREKVLFHGLFSHQTIPFYKLTNNALVPVIAVDLNFSILWGESDQVINQRGFISNYEFSDFLGIRVKRLTPVHEFVALCLHHYKDMNSIYLLWKKGYRLYEFIDIYYYLINQSISPTDLYEVSSNYGVTPYLYFCLYYTYILFENPKLMRYLNILESKESLELIEKYGLDNNEKHEWSIPFKERVLKKDLRDYLSAQLSDFEISKILKNETFF